MSKVMIYSPPSTAQIKRCSVDFDLRREPPKIYLVQYDKTLPVVEVALNKGGTAYQLPEDAEVNIRMGKRNKLAVYNPVLGCNEDRDRVYVEITTQMTTQDGVFDPILELLVGGGIAGTSPIQFIVQRNPVQDDAVEDETERKTIAEYSRQASESASAAAKSAEDAGESVRVVQENEESIKFIQDNISDINAVAQNGSNISAVGGSIDSVNTVAENLTSIQEAVDNIEDIRQAPQKAAEAADSATLSQSWAIGGTGAREGEDTDNAKYWCAEAQKVAQGALGWYESESALKSAHPIGQDGQWALVGETDTIWTWDSDTSSWVNTAAKIDLSNYYTKNQSNARFEMPVGYIFEWAPVSGQSVDLSTPEKVAQYFGYGTWAEYAPGKVLAGVNDSHRIGTSVGAETHAITTAEMPAHEHGIHGWSVAQPGSGTTQFTATYPYTQYDNFPGTTRPVGGGQAMSLMQPTQYVYRWQRIK